jgi:hypothetical protein
MKSDKSFDIPGKVFVLGEYAVLGGLPALIAGVSPRFTGSLLEKADGDGDHHPDSPVGRFLRWAQERRGLRCSFHFEDPYRSGGFGASTAQFAIAYAAAAAELGLSRDWWDVLRFYRDLTVVDGKSPSGADLIAQWRGGVSLFDPASLRCVDLWTEFDWSRLLVFSPEDQSDRKVATHTHLKAFFSEDGREINHAQLFSRLAGPLKKGLTAVGLRSVHDLGAAMNEYADALAEYGLEARATSDDRRALGTLPGVCGVKGAGAMQADVVIVLIAPEADPAPIIRSALSQGLKPISNALTWQRGITCHS